ncbi:MAG: hypothetical protein AAF465_08695 [Pseudomonadota bacterium]
MSSLIRTAIVRRLVNRLRDRIGNITKTRHRKKLTDHRHNQKGKKHAHAVTLAHHLDEQKPPPTAGPQGDATRPLAG